VIDAVVQLGDFTLGDKLGQGGAGQVWRAEHRSGQSAAVKVVTASFGREAGFVAILENEVEAAARLYHPAVAMLLDVGRVSNAASEASDGRLVAGSPFFAMELASGGSLAGLEGPLEWPALRHVLVVLLRALAHAHAYGVVHRDLKPANVLLCTEADVRPGLKLADFGMARATEVSEGESVGAVSGGTPRYMAPEQFDVGSRDIGPWTDLYSLGCLTWRMATGDTPFSGELAALALAHAHRVPPPFVSHHRTPDGLAAWVERLLRKEPLSRFRTAADALAALYAIDPAARDEVAERPPPELLARTPAALALDKTRTALGAPTEVSPAFAAKSTAGTHLAPEWDDGGLSVTTPLRGSRLERVEARRRPRVTPPPAPAPFPEDWRMSRGAPKMPEAALVGAGLGLYGLRTIPLAGREAERDTLFAALAEVRRDGRPRAVVLRGASGAGKSRLVESFARRCVELGAANLVFAHYAAFGGGGTGIAPMVARLVGLHGLSGEEAVTRAARWHHARGVEDICDPLETAALGAPSPASASSEGPSIFGHERERRAALRRLLVAYARERPLVVWLDDVQWGVEALAFALSLVAEETEAPLLLALTAREEALAGGGRAARLLDELLDYDSTREMVVPPLVGEDHARLVRELLGLQPALAERVRARTEGSPLFAVQLVGDWVERRVLVPTPRGFELREGAEDVLPDDLHEVWGRHLGGVLEGAGYGGRVALELAAVLGLDVDAEEWAALCEQTRQTEGVDLSALVARMVRRRLAQRTERGFSFVHAMLREALERGAREEGRWSGHHALAAQMLEQRSATELSSERLGRHLLAAGDAEGAERPLLAAAQERQRTGELLAAEVLLEEHDEALRRLDIDDDDPRRAAPLALRAEVLQFTHGGEARGLEVSRDVIRRDGVPGWDEAVLRAELVVGYLDHVGGRFEEAAEMLGRARTRAARAGDRPRELAAQLGLADLEYYAGDRPEAGRVYERAVVMAEALDDRPQLGRALWSVGYVSLWAGEVARARDAFERSLAAALELRDHLAILRATMSLSDAALVAGDLERAYEMAESCRAHLFTSGLRGELILESNLASIDIAAGDYESALRRAEYIGRLQNGGESPYLSYAADARRCVIAGWRGDWGAFDHHLQALRERYEVERFRDGDLALLLERAAQLAEAGGKAGRAAEAWEFASVQWQGTGWREREDAARTAVERLAPERKTHSS
jgi:tetratricopeptide (TPR) repeat protein